MLFELAAQDRAGVAAAAELGVDRVELCTALALGGLTPSAAAVRHAVTTARAGGAPVHVLVRPRSGGFDYSSDEVEGMRDDIRWLVDEGVDGVVVGVTRSGAVDHSALASLVDAAGTIPVAFHRAIDTLADPVAAIGVLVGLGITRILTSGGAARVGDGLGMLRELSDAAAGRLELTAGGGVDVGLIPAIATAGAHSVHASAKLTRVDDVSVTLGSADGGGAGEWEATDIDLARALRDAAWAAAPEHAR